jgi:hypothetical protein
MSGVGDVDGDNVPDFLVGARFQDVDGNAGAYLFSGATQQLIYKIENPVPQPGASFGRWTNRAGDVDGVPDLFIGAPFAEVDGFFQSGLAHVFSGADGHLIYTFRDPTGALLHTFANPSPQDGARFGFRFVELGGDANGDGIPDLLLGAFKQDVSPVRPMISDAHGGGHGASCPFDDRFPIRGRPGEPDRYGPEANEGQAFLYVSRRL